MLTFTGTHKCQCWEGTFLPTTAKFGAHFGSTIAKCQVPLGPKIRGHLGPTRGKFGGPLDPVMPRWGVIGHPPWGQQGPVWVNWMCPYTRKTQDWTWVSFDAYRARFCEPSQPRPLTTNPHLTPAKKEFRAGSVGGS